MGDEPATTQTAGAPDGSVQVGYKGLSEKERKIAEAVHAETKTFMVSGFRDLLVEERKKWEKETDPATRPGFSAASPSDSAEAKAIERYGVLKGSGKESKGGWMPPLSSVEHSVPVLDHEREDFGAGFAAFVDDLASKGAKAGPEKGGVPFSVLKFPRGDIDNFSVCRWAMALERSKNTAEGSTSFTKNAPWETAYYAALEAYGESKAQGDMVSGQDGGYLAPELWSTQFIDQVYPQMATSRLPITRVPMGNRVVHIPRLSSNIQVNYGAENASLTAQQAQLQQLSFTARKQYAFVQISNELIRDANPSAMTILQANAAKYMALDMDYQILLGNGLAGTPYGLYNQTNVTKANGANGGGFNGAAAPAGVGSNSKYPLLDDLTNGIFNVEDLNNSTNVPIGQANVTGIVGAVALKLGVTAANDKALGVSGGSARPNYGFGYQDMRWANRPDGSSALDGFLGVQNWVLSNIVKHSLKAGSGGASAAPTSNTSVLAAPNPAAVADMNPVFFGDWQHLWVMVRQDVEILASNVAGTSFQNDQTWVRLIRRYDVGVAHPEPFFVVTNG